MRLHLDARTQKFPFHNILLSLNFCFTFFLSPHSFFVAVNSFAFIQRNTICITFSLLLFKFISIFISFLHLFSVSGVTFVSMKIESMPKTRTAATTTRK